MSARCGCETLMVVAWDGTIVKDMCEHECTCGMGTLKWRDPHLESLLVHCAACGKHVDYSRTRRKVA